MIDCHVLTTGEIPFDSSLEQEGVRFLKGDPIAGDLLTARCRGFELGDAQFVSFADPDDKILPGAFLALNRAIGEHPAVTTNSVLVYASGHGALARNYREVWSLQLQAFAPLCVHQLIAVRRDIMLEAAHRAVTQTPEHLKNIATGQLLFAHVAAICGWHFDPTIGYVWFDHPNGFHRRATTEQRKELREYLGSHVLKVRN